MEERLPLLVPATTPAARTAAGPPPHLQEDETSSAAQQHHGDSADPAAFRVPFGWLRAGSRGLARPATLLVLLLSCGGWLLLLVADLEALTRHQQTAVHLARRSLTGRPEVLQLGVLGLGAAVLLAAWRALALEMPGRHRRRLLRAALRHRHILLLLLLMVLAVIYGLCQQPCGYSPATHRLGKSTWRAVGIAGSCCYALLALLSLLVLVLFQGVGGQPGAGSGAAAKRSLGELLFVLTCTLSHAVLAMHMLVALAVAITALQQLQTEAEHCDVKPTNTLLLCCALYFHVILARSWWSCLLRRPVADRQPLKADMRSAAGAARSVGSGSSKRQQEALALASSYESAEQFRTGSTSSGRPAAAQAAAATTATTSFGGDAGKGSNRSQPRIVSLHLDDDAKSVSSRTSSHSQGKATMRNGGAGGGNAGVATAGGQGDRRRMNEDMADLNFTLRRPDSMDLELEGDATLRSAPTMRNAKLEFLEDMSDDEDADMDLEVDDADADADAAVHGNGGTPADSANTDGMCEYMPVDDMMESGGGYPARELYGTVEGTDALGASAASEPILQGSGDNVAFGVRELAAGHNAEQLYEELPGGDLFAAGTVGAAAGTVGVGSATAPAPQSGSVEKKKGRKKLRKGKS